MKKEILTVEEWEENENKKFSAKCLWFPFSGGDISEY